uniref:Ankyrin repeat domain-containing protein 29 n=1 Tax=Cacopsylla melanoneura TaxID=428564 RepID=A0A8D8S235_9HEMI
MSMKKETPADVRFHLAAINGKLDTIVKLLDSGRVHVDCQDKDGTTPLILAVANGHYEVVEELLNQGADPNVRRCTGTTALFFAAQNGFTDIASLLIAQGAKIDPRSYDGATPLFVSCQCGHTLMSELLMHHGANVNMHMRDGATPLFIACQNGHSSIVHLLTTSAGVEIDVRRLDGTTPLWMAAQMGHARICRSLLQCGSFVDATRLDGASPLFKACHKGHTSVVEEYNPNLGVLPNGESAVHAACLGGHLSCVKLLIRAGASPNLVNVEGLTPTDLALSNKHYNVTQYLTKKS